MDDAKRRGASQDEIAKEIDRDAPELASWKDVLPKTRSELYFVIAIIISIAALSTGDEQDKIETNIQIEQVINNIYQQNSQTRPVKKVEKVGRNEPCPCGSGKKYKKCCIVPR